MLGEWKARGCSVEMVTSCGLRQFGDVFASLDFSIAVRLAEPARLAVGDAVSIVAWDDRGGLRKLVGEVLQVHGRFVAVAILLGWPRRAACDPPGRQLPPQGWLPPVPVRAASLPLCPAPATPHRHESRLDYWIGRRVVPRRLGGLLPHPPA